MKQTSPNHRDEAAPTVTLEHVTKRFDDVTVVDDLAFDVERGDFVVLIGPSGCGKTTTLKMVNRLVEPTSGRIRVHGEDTTEMNKTELRRQIGYVIQEIGLFPHMTVSQNISVVPNLLGWSGERIARRIDELLAMVDMAPDTYRDRFPQELSGGQQQRIGVLRALAADPDIILMDEPFGALDPITREQLQDEFKHLQKHLQKTILFVTHDMDEALKLADLIVLMRKGRKVQAAAPEDILRHPANDYVRSFIGKDRLLRSADHLTVGELMRRNVVTMDAEKGLAHALETMRKQKVDSLIILQDRDRYHGVLWARDLHPHLQRNAGLSVGALAKDTLPTVTRSATVRQAMNLMDTHAFGFIPVVENGTLKGLLTRSELVDVLAESMDTPAATVQPLTDCEKSPGVSES